ncbi:hypothetical protein DRO91_00075 [Candidatus Heimdallarchaeota archaeon]|nr:MAG: hypothetical protein DRP02_04665 [Candidatus Gerdarchaeota archaeon]RLI74579.1 MAG: hypothetical protein DRO91_00075 [Candidatus Heimdallarchaeota archaeon]
MQNVPQNNWTLEIIGPFQRATRAISEQESERIRQLLLTERFLDFYRDYRDNISFYCPKCQAAYCKDHWTNYQMIIDDGFFDYATAICPLGHEVVVDD